MPQAINISLESLNLGTLAPMIIAIIGALSIIIADIFNKRHNKSLYIILVLLFLSFDLFTLLAFKGDEKGVFDMLLLDGLSILSQIIIIVGSAFFVFLNFSKLRFQDARYAEYFAFYLFMIAGFQFMVSSDSLILIFIGLETASLSLVIMIAMYNRMGSIEAAIKYFSMGALSAGFFVFACMIIYALTGTLELEQISLVISEQNILSRENFSNYVLILVAFVFIFMTLCFKLSLFPFHTWVPDVYQGSSSAMAGYISAIPKMAAFIVALRIFEIFVNSEDKIIYYLLYFIVVLTMTIPNIMALLQNDLKRMLSYSSISNAGIAMCAILIGTSQSYNALFLYWILFTASNFGAFGMLWINRGKVSGDYTSAYTYDKFSGLVQTSPMIASLLGLFLFALTGLPPFALFWGKMYLIASAVNAGEIILAIIIIFNSVIAAYYYVKPVSYMFLKDPLSAKDTKSMQNATLPLKFALGIAVIFTISSIFYIEEILSIINYYIMSTG